MMADAGEEHVEVLRLLDYEGFPVDDLAYKLSAFLERIKARGENVKSVFPRWSKMAPIHEVAGSIQIPFRTSLK